MFPSCEDAAHSKATGAATRGDASWINKSQYFSLISDFYKQSIDIRRTCCAALAGCVASSILVVRVRARAHIIGEGHDVEEVQDPLGSLTCLLGLTWLSRVIKQQQEKPLAGHLLDWAWWAPPWPHWGIPGDWIRSEKKRVWHGVMADSTTSTSNTESSFRTLGAMPCLFVYVQWWICFQVNLWNLKLKFIRNLLIYVLWEDVLDTPMIKKYKSLDRLTPCSTYFVQIMQSQMSNPYHIAIMQLANNFSLN